MKKILFSISLILIVSVFFSTKGYSQCNDDLLGTCMPKIGKSKFLKHFPIRLKESKSGAPIEKVKFKITLSKGNTYNFMICNAQEFPGKAVINLYQGMRLVATSYDQSTKKHYPGVTYNCSTSAIYNLTFNFEDGKEGCAVGIMAQQ